MRLEDLRHVYFLGIGGIGMSALARFCVHRGIRVSGYDKTATPLTEKLTGEGMQICYSDDPGLIPPGVDAVIYTPAVPPANRAFRHFERSGLPMMKRAKFLGLVSSAYRTIAVAGTHGKTTISSLLVWLLRNGGVDCTAFLGGILAGLNTNFLAGSSPWVVLEADEYDRSFLHLEPDAVILSAMDADHLDIYDTEAAMQEAYFEFLGRVKRGGTVLLQHAVAAKIPGEVFESFRANGIEALTYGIEQGDVSSGNCQVKHHQMQFDVKSTRGVIRDISLRMAGLHNVENATAAIEMAIRTGVETQDIPRILKGFSGIRRRFEFWRTDPSCPVIDDYAHHPEEIRAAIQAAKLLYPGRKLTVIFQPHLFSRTRDFAAEFGAALSGADTVILVEIYPAREDPLPGVSSALISSAMTHDKVFLTTKAALTQCITKHPPELLMTLGAGDIDQELPEIITCIE